MAKGPPPCLGPTCTRIKRPKAPKTPVNERNTNQHNYLIVYYRVPVLESTHVTILFMRRFEISGSAPTTSGERSLDAADQRPGVDREGAGGRHHRLPHLRDRAQDGHHPSQGRNSLEKEDLDEYETKETLFQMKVKFRMSDKKFRAI